MFDRMNAETLVNIITNEGSVKELLKISARRTNRDKAAVIALKALNLARTQVFKDSPIDEYEDFPPPALRK